MAVASGTASHIPAVLASRCPVFSCEAAVLAALDDDAAIVSGDTVSVVDLFSIHRAASPLCVDPAVSFRKHSITSCSVTPSINCIA